MKRCGFFIIWSMISMMISACELPMFQNPAREGQQTTPFEQSDAPSLNTAQPSWMTQPTLMPLQEDLALQKRGLRSEFVMDVDTHAGITQYWIELDVDFDPLKEIARLQGITRIRFSNPFDADLEDIALMLWPNDRQYQAEMTAGPIQIGEALIDPKIDPTGIILQVPLPTKLPPGETIDISLPFQVIASGLAGDQGPSRFGITQGVLIAPTFYPILPRLVDGKWQTAVGVGEGDAISTDIAYYHVTITTDRKYVVVASGVELERRVLDGRQQSWTFVTGPMRDFAFAVGNLEELREITASVDLRAWVLPEHRDQGLRLLNVARLQMDFLSEVVGPYPYAELDFVDAPGAFGGIEYPGLIYMGVLGTGDFVGIAVHEVAHQWFYGLIGNDQLREPWLDEAAATFWQILCLEETIGKERAKDQLNNYRYWISQAADMNQPIGLGVGDYLQSQDYYLLTYFKGALFFDALRTHMGDEVFFDFLHTYFQTYRYGFASSEGFQEVAERVCACELDPLFDLWVFQGGEIAP